MRTVEGKNGLRRITPEPRAPMSATKTNRAACVEPEIPLRSTEENMSSKFLTSHHKLITNEKNNFLPYLHYCWLSTVKFVSHQRGEWPNRAASQFRTTAGWVHRTALYAAALCSQSTRNNNPMAEMDDTAHAFLKRSLYYHSK